MSDPKIIYQNSLVEINKIIDEVSIKEKNPLVLILPYTLNASGNPQKIGLIKKSYPHRGDKKHYGVISILPLKDDIDVLSTAKRGLKKEYDLDIDNTDKWEYLGNIHTSDFLINGNPAFGVDVSNSKIKDTEETKIELVSIIDGIEHDDALISCLFLKIFQSKLIENI